MFKWLFKNDSWCAVLVILRKQQVWNHVSFKGAVRSPVMILPPPCPAPLGCSSRRELEAQTGSTMGAAQTRVTQLDPDLVERTGCEWKNVQKFSQKILEVCVILLELSRRKSPSEDFFGGWVGVDPPEDTRQHALCSKVRAQSHGSYQRDFGLFY